MKVEKIELELSTENGTLIHVARLNSSGPIHAEGVLHPELSATEKRRAEKVFLAVETAARFAAKTFHTTTHER